MPPDRTNRRQWIAAVAAGGAALTTSLLGESAAMAETTRDAPIVDPHVHIWKHDARYPFAEGQTPPDEDALPEDLLRLMRANGVAATVIVHVIYYRWDCRYTASVLRKYPDKFMGVCRVDPQSPDAAHDLDRWIAEGYHGVRISPTAGPEGDWIRDRAQMDLIAGRAGALGVPLCVLCPITRIPDVEPIIARHQDSLDICIDHMADCPVDQPEELRGW
jgi:predicted TIM-barrel fold metal-dependent hydrolase